MGLKTDYRVRFMAPIRELGCGNFGAVFEALREPDTAAARAGAPGAVAVKVLPREQMTLESGGLRQLGKEIDIWGEVQHSLSVVSFEGVFQEGASDVRLVMERCGGPTLEEAGLPLPVSEVRDVAVQVLEAVAQCHARKILHRDIKPANFMRASDAIGAPLKMLDFGLSTYFYGRPKTTRCGAPLFMAPELVAGSYGPPADVWSVGVLLFACTVGRTPWEPTDGRELSKPALFSRIACPKFLPDLFRGSAEWLAFPPGFRNLVERLMERDPSRRLTAVQALQHPWLERQQPPRARGGGESGDEDDGRLVQRLQAFGGLGRALRALLVELYRSLPAEARGSPPLSEGPGSAPRAAAVTSVELQRWLRGRGYVVSPEEAFFLADSVSLGLEARGALRQDEIGAAALDWPALYGTEPWHDGVDRLALRLGSSAGKGYEVTGAALRSLLAQHGVSEGDMRRLGGASPAGRQVWAGKPLQDVLLAAWAAESCSPDVYPARRPPPLLPRAPP